MELRTDYVDSEYTQKKYKVTSYGSGVVSFQDTTAYSVAGDYYGAEDINLQNLECNYLNADYAVVDELIAILQSRGITVANKSPDAILSALQTDCANYYEAGRDNGHLEVQTFPTKYGMVDTASYDSAEGLNTIYTTKIANAKGILNTNLPYTPYGDAPSMPSVSDPITSAQANNVKNTYKNWLDGVLEAFTAFYTPAYNALSQASNELRL
jgi:hypothetical protein